MSLRIMPLSISGEVTFAYSVNKNALQYSNTFQKRRNVNLYTETKHTECHVILSHLFARHNVQRDGHK